VSPKSILERDSTRRTIFLLLLGLFVFFWGVLAFHHHPDGLTHDECSLCRLSFQFSSFLLANQLSIFLAAIALILEAAQYCFPRPSILTYSLYPRAPPTF
jgi:hypothetical protein